MASLKARIERLEDANRAGSPGTVPEGMSLEDALLSGLVPSPPHEWWVEQLEKQERSAAGSDEPCSH